MVHIRKSESIPVPPSTQPDSSQRKESVKELFTLPAKSGIEQANEPIEPSLAIMKTAFRGMGAVPPCKQPDEMIACFYSVMAQYLK